MRIATVAIVVLILSGCAPTGLSRYPENRSRVDRTQVDREARAQREVRRARADSLLALPPDSLSSNDLRWLQIFYQDRDQANRDEQTAEIKRTRQMANNWIIIGIVGSAVMGLVSYLVIVESY